VQHLPKDLVGCPVFQDLPWPVVDQLYRMLHLLVCDLSEVAALGEELPQEPIGVLNCRLLPGMVRVAEVELHASKGLCDICMPCELLAPLRRERLEGTSL